MTRKKVSEGRNKLSGQVISSMSDGSFTSIESEKDMKKQNVVQETERLSNRVWPYVKPQGYLNVSERKKMFRLEATCASYEEGCLEEKYHPIPS